MPGGIFLFEEPPLDDRLGGDAGVVGAGHPEGLEALHPLLPDEHVLQGVVQGVAQVQGPGHVGRRNDDRVGFSPRVRLAMEVILLFPEAIPAILGRGVVVLLGQLG